jgi:hypothetical protein
LSSADIITAVSFWRLTPWSFDFFPEQPASGWITQVVFVSYLARK